MMVTIYKNPVDKRKEKIDVDASVWVFLCGPIYLAIKGLWTHVLIWLVIVVPTSIAFGMTGLLLSVSFASIIYALTVQSLLIEKCVRKGWKEVREKPSTPYEILQARLYADSINGTYTNYNPVREVPATRHCEFCDEETPAYDGKCHHCHAELNSKIASA